MTALVINADHAQMQATSPADYDEQTFHPLPDYPLLQYMQTADIKRRLLQFDIGRSANVQVLSYSHPFDTASIPATTAVVTKLLQTINITAPSTISLTPLRTSISSINFFDRLRTSDVVTETGCIRQCYEIIYNNIIINDELRKMCLTDESNDYDLYNHNDRLELIYILLQHIVIGGSLCQPSEMLNDYVELVKAMYKTLVRPTLAVTKDGRTSSSAKSAAAQEIRILNRVYSVTAEVGSKSAYPFDSVNPSNLCLVSIDAEEQTMAVYTFNYKTHW